MADTNGPKPRDNDVTLPPPDEDGGVSVSSSNPEAPQPDDVIHAGKRIGKYLVRRLIGRGGMGTVYEAMDVPLQRKVALKILPREFSQNDEALKRFVREAQLAARLNHPNVVTIFDVGRKGTVYFIAMELVLGTSGQELLESGKKLDWREAARAVTDVCRALGAAHDGGLFHRDIKPGNILWSQTGNVKLGDFGLAKPTQTPEELSITRRDAFIGTPLFMSPEQCRNDGVDHRSDIYSLGATFYTLLTGKAPYNQGSAIQILFAHCSAPIPDVRDTIPDVPPLCTYIVQKAMAKNPDDRYQSAREMRHDLEALLGDRGTMPPDLKTPQPATPAAAPAVATKPRFVFASEPEFAISAEPAFDDEIASLSVGEVARPAPQSVTDIARPSKKRSPALFVSLGLAAAVALAAGIGYFSMQSGGEAGPLAQDANPPITPIPPAAPVAANTLEPAPSPVLAAQSPATLPAADGAALAGLTTVLTVVDAPETVKQDESVGPGLIPPEPLDISFGPSEEERRHWRGRGGPDGMDRRRDARPSDARPAPQPQADVPLGPAEPPQAIEPTAEEPPREPASEPMPERPQAAPPRDDRPSAIDDDEENDLQGLTLGEIRDPLLRQYARAKRFAAKAAVDRDDASIEIAAQSLVLWADFLHDAPVPMHRKWSHDARQMAEKLKPGIDMIKPRATPDDPRAILPPPDHKTPDDARPQPPGQRRPGGPRRD